MSNGTEILPMWDWIEYAEYMGRAYNEDEWIVYYVSKSTKIIKLYTLNSITGWI